MLEANCHCSGSEAETTKPTRAQSRSWWEKGENIVDKKVPRPGWWGWRGIFCRLWGWRRHRKGQAQRPSSGHEAARLGERDPGAHMEGMCFGVSGGPDAAAPGKASGRLTWGCWGSPHTEAMGTGGQPGPWVWGQMGGWELGSQEVGAAPQLPEAEGTQRAEKMLRAESQGNAWLKSRGDAGEGARASKICVTVAMAKRSLREQWSCGQEEWLQVKMGRSLWERGAQNKGGSFNCKFPGESMTFKLKWGSSEKLPSRWLSSFKDEGCVGCTNQDHHLQFRKASGMGTVF